MPETPLPITAIWGACERSHEGAREACAPFSAWWTKANNGMCEGCRQMGPGGHTHTSRQPRAHFAVSPSLCPSPLTALPPPRKAADHTRKKRKRSFASEPQRAHYCTVMVGARRLETPRNRPAEEKERAEGEREEGKPLSKNADRYDHVTQTRSVCSLLSRRSGKALWL